MLPRVVTSSVVRSTHQGESHGGVYLVELESGEYEQVIDWNDPGINWEGRGSDRGLRGIAVYQGKVYLAASDELFVYDRQFKLLESFRNPYLRHCHEICLAGDTLYLASTGLNSILEFSLTLQRWTRAFQIRRKENWRAGWARWRGRGRYCLESWDPESDTGPSAESSDLHLNNVSVHHSSLLVAGTRVPSLLQLQDGTVTEVAPLPLGTHNATLAGDRLIYNDTAAARVTVASTANIPGISFNVPIYDAQELSHTDLPRDHARQGFARGLVLANDDLIIAGSSPSTISAYSLSERQKVKSVRLSQDVRNCIHGLALWPF